MRKLLAVCLIAGLATSSFASFSNTSMRLNGINPNLAGIITDEYTDAFTNVADILNVKGYRGYTNLSNLYNNKTASVGNDQAFSGAPGNTAFLLGGFGNPFTKWNVPGQMGLFYTMDGGITTPVHNQMSLTSFGETTNDTVTQTDVNTNGSFTDIGDTLTTIHQRAKRQIDSEYSSIEAKYAMPAPFLIGLNLGVNLSYRNAADAGGAAGIVNSSEEPIEAEYQSTFLRYGTPNTVNIQDQSQFAKDKYDNSSMNIGFGGRYDLNDKMDCGATLALQPISIQQTRSSLVHIFIDNTVAGAANPHTVDATMVDGSQFIAPGGLPAAIGSVNIPAGFLWTNNAAGNQAMGPNGEMMITGLTLGNEVGSFKEEGNQIALSADSHYQVSDTVKFTGRINYSSLPGTLDASMSLPYDQVTRGAVVAGDKDTVNNLTSYLISGGKAQNDALGVTVGGEAHLKDNVLVGFGINYTMSTAETAYNWEQDVKNVDTYDQTNNGFSNSAGSGDSRTTVTSSIDGRSSQKSNASVIQIPIGFEMRPYPKWPIRLGVTHQIATSKTTTVTTPAGSIIQTKTVTDTNGATLPAVYSPTQATGETTATKTQSTNSTAYYYGMGYDWSENLVFDILGVASGSSVFDLNTWRIGATLKF